MANDTPSAAAASANSEQTSGHGHGSSDFAHPSEPRTLLATFAALILLTILTVLVAAVFDMGRWEVWVSLGIATVKASLVILFFMHMLHDKPFNALFFLGSVLFVALFIGVLLMDTEQYKSDIDELPATEMPVREVGKPKMWGG